MSKTKKYQILFLLYLPFILLLSILLLISKHKLVLRLVEHYAWFFEPLTVFMLLPGYLREGQEPILLKAKQSKHYSKLMFIIGGNKSIPKETLEGLEGSVLPDGDNFGQYPKNGEIWYVCPLTLHRSEKRYLIWLMKRLNGLLKRYQEIDEVVIVGHSLGGGLAAKLAQRMIFQRNRNKKIKFSLSINRSFGRLWQAAQIKYTKIGGLMLERIFSSFWELNTLKALESLSKIDMNISITQVYPDHILEPNSYLVPQAKKEKWWCPNWKTQEVHAKKKIKLQNKKTTHSISISFLLKNTKDD